MEDIQREKDEASLAAIAAVWPNFDEPNDDGEGPTASTRSSSRDHGNMWGGRIANPLQQRTFSGTSNSNAGSSDTRSASLVVSGMTGMYNPQSLSEQTEPMLSSYDYQEEDCWAKDPNEDGNSSINYIHKRAIWECFWDEVKMKSWVFLNVRFYYYA